MWVKDCDAGIREGGRKSKLRPRGSDVGSHPE